MKKFALTFAWLLGVLAGNLFGQPRGYLVIIGGGERPDYMMKKIVELAGGGESKFLVIPMASSEPRDTALRQKEQLEKMGAGPVDFIMVTRETADHDTNLAKLDGVSGIFFSGGDQSRLTEALLGTQFLERIKHIYHTGGVIVGTSAGAAVMSKLMITGDELKNQDEENPFKTIAANNIQVKEGFGFIESAIIDQHFIRRKRHNRLISLVLENPRLLGIGIDEATAIIVKPDQAFEVLGENTVLVYDAAKVTGISADANGNLSAANLKMHILRSGQIFSLKKKKLLR